MATDRQIEARRERLHFAFVVPVRLAGRTRCKTLEPICGHFRRSVAATTVGAEVTCVVCLKALQPRDRREGTTQAADKGKD